MKSLGISLPRVIAEFVERYEQSISHRKVGDGANQRAKIILVRRFKFESIFTFATGHGNRTATGIDRIIATAAYDDLKSRYLVATDLFALGDTLADINDDAQGRRRIVQHVGAGIPCVHVVTRIDSGGDAIIALAAMDHVFAIAVRQDVIARAAFQDVVAIAAIKRIVSVPAGKIIFPGVALQGVVAGSALQRIIACAAFELVVAAAAIQVSS